MDAIKNYLPKILWGELDRREVIPYLIQPKGINEAKKKYYANF
jgi:hypothetical protein